MGEIIKANKGFNRTKFNENYDNIDWSSPGGSKSENKRRESLRKLTQESQELGLYDEDNSTIEDSLVGEK